ncbi:MAG: trypsin-like peptidase domain-containing protein [Fidelibacterota bacterium]
MKKGLFSIIVFTICLVLLVLSVQFYLDARRHQLIRELTSEDTVDTGNADRSELTDKRITINRETAVTRTIAAASPAIIGIHVTMIQEYSNNPFFNDPFFRRFFPNNIYKKRIQSLGSGVLISEDGYIVTNAHVLGDSAVEIYVTLSGGKRYPAERVGADPLTDIALLKIDEKDLPYMEMGDSDDIMIGEWVIALGNPFGLFNVSDKPIATVGIISSTNMNFGETREGYVYQNMIQTDASINSGNSGGGLVNMNGELIGINTFIFTGNDYGSSGSVGIGFAIPINRVHEIVEELKLHGNIERNWDFGISGQPLTSSIINYYQLDTDHGIIIIDIREGKAGDKAGLRVGDIILSVNDQEVKRNQDVVDIINNSYLKVGDSIKARIYRDGEELSVKIPLEK